MLIKQISTGVALISCCYLSSTQCFAQSQAASYAQNYAESYEGSQSATNQGGQSNSNGGDTRASQSNGSDFQVPPGPKADSAATVWHSNTPEVTKPATTTTTSTAAPAPAAKPGKDGKTPAPTAAAAEVKNPDLIDAYSRLHPRRWPKRW